jgi:WD40 repeat protein
MQLFSGELTTIRLLAVSVRGDWLAARGVLSPPRRWERQTPKQALTLFKGNSDIHHLASLPDGGLLALGTNGSGSRWLPDNQWRHEPLRTLFGGPATQSALSRGGKFAAFARHGGVRVGLVGAGQPTWSGVLNTTEITSDYFARLAFSGNAQVLAARSQYGQLRRWQTSDGQPLPTLQPSQAGADLGLHLSGDGSRAGILARNGIQLCTEHHAEWLPDHPAGVWPTAVALAPQGTGLAVGRQNGLVELWDLPPAGEPLPPQYAPVRTLDWRMGTVSALAFADDGLTLAVGGHTGPACLWDVD